GAIVVRERSFTPTTNERIRFQGRLTRCQDVSYSVAHVHCFSCSKCRGIATYHDLFEVCMRCYGGRDGLQRPFSFFYRCPQVTMSPPSRWHTRSSSNTRCQSVFDVVIH
ncbi:unnamed protein product, partial [Ectocarpus fasciculatus]